MFILRQTSTKNGLNVEFPFFISFIRRSMKCTSNLSGTFIANVEDYTLNLHVIRRIFLFHRFCVVIHDGDGDVVLFVLTDDDGKTAAAAVVDAFTYVG